MSFNFIKYNSSSVVTAFIDNGNWVFYCFSFIVNKIATGYENTKRFMTR